MNFYEGSTLVRKEDLTCVLAKQSSKKFRFSTLGGRSETRVRYDSRNVSTGLGANRVEFGSLQNKKEYGGAAYKSGWRRRGESNHPHAGWQPKPSLLLGSVSHALFSGITAFQSTMTSSACIAPFAFSLSTPRSGLATWEQRY